MAETQSGNRTQRAYRVLRGHIISCRLRPDEKLVISDLCETLGVSLGAVREALSRLTSEGLVVLEPNKGFRVAPITQEELADITAVRARIETLCLAEAIAHADLKWESGIVAAVHELARIPLRDKLDLDRISDAWTDAHRRFHEALVKACPSDWLRRIREMLYAQSERYRQFSVPLEKEGRDINAEHQAIVDAALARDKKLACRLLREHLERTTQILIASSLVENQRAAEIHL